MIYAGKVGVPFHYSNSHVRSHVFIVFKIPSRMVQGIVRGLSEYFWLGEPLIGNHNTMLVVIVKIIITNFVNPS
jgi:hypothetical protein